MIRAALIGAAMAALVAGCGDDAATVRAENATAGSIPAGIYSDVRLHGETGDLLGLEMALSAGSDSKTAEITVCDGMCQPVQTVAVRKGLNGIFFELQGQAEQPVLFAVERNGQGVTLNVDWPSGFESYLLAKVDREWGLRVARGL